MMTMVQSNMKDPKAITGKTVLAWLIGFFGVIFTANAIFLYLAFGSFPGVVVESSYEAGQAYNREIAAAKAQEELRWQVTNEVTRTTGAGAKVQVTALDAKGTPLYGVDVKAALRRPAQGEGDVELFLNADGGGRYTADVSDLPAGNWNLVLVIEQDGKRMFKSENRIFLTD
ncbi:FixH family protein [Roseibium porphyridii]|uniref:FixH family protein n=1 Tax=Roseibium porphyridii TaxID=2866279 RepID=A0ABY8EZR6_9HYPH|nr:MULTISPECIES: FixH family protein [Stappiaceae]WFE88677.1 FixH family protein [Roseibium sp. KMA01]